MIDGATGEILDADAIIKKKDHRGMKGIYEKVRALYKVIPKEYKAQVLKKCMELHDQLSAKDVTAK